MTTENKEIAKIQPSQSERFTNMVIKEFSSNSGGTVALTDFQKRLCQNYFIETDKVLKKAEEKRLKQAESKRDSIPVTWENVNMGQLALDVVSVSRIGLDPAQSNHINMIPYKNNKTAKYDIGFIIGYMGCEIKAKKYGLDIPDDVIIEVVFSTDTFKQIKKDKDHKIESYEFKVNEDFNRGAVVGGFYYYSYFDHPEKNSIRVFSKAQIEKRRPDYYSPEFWGGEKDEWVDGKKTGNKIKIEGWYEEMVYKTLCRAAYNSFPIDSQKIDDDYLLLSSREKEALETDNKEIRENANKQILSIDDIQTPEDVTPVVEVKEQPTPPTTEEKEQPKQKAAAGGPSSELFPKAGPAKPRF